MTPQEGPPTSRSVVNFKGLCGIGLTAVALVACNPPADYALVGSAFVPAAHGDIRIEKIDKEQRLIVVQLDHLPAPEEVREDYTHYVVWFSEVGSYPVSQGTLDYDRETRTGRASIPTSLEDLDVQVTAESTETPSRPSDLLVAAQKIRED